MEWPKKCRLLAVRVRVHIFLWNALSELSAATLGVCRKYNIMHARIVEHVPLPPKLFYAISHLSAPEHTQKAERLEELHCLSVDVFMPKLGKHQLRIPHRSPFEHEERKALHRRRRTGKYIFLPKFRRKKPRDRSTASLPPSAPWLRARRRLALSLSAAVVCCSWS